MTDAVAEAARLAAREESARIVATVVRVTGDWELAEDCMQDAFARALRVWARDGIPSRPGAWLTTVARNRAIDQLRRASAERRALAGLQGEAELEATGGGEMDAATDAHDRLSLIFTCCHPALPLEARVALTLRTVAGLEVAEIARAFLVSEPTMEKRLVRARARIRNAGIPYRVPPPERRLERLGGVEAVLYLLFSEGYSSTETEQLVRASIAEEAIRLAGMLVDALDALGGSADADLPQPVITAEPRSLLALMLLQHARRSGRVTASGELVPLEHQDRSGWDRATIDEAVALLDTVARDLAAAGAPPGAYFLQAGIAAVHAAAPDVASTDFRAIVSLYRALARTQPSPVIELNLAVAVSVADGPLAGLALVEQLDRDGALADYYLLHAARADLLRRLERGAEAIPHYRRALELAPSPAERRFLRSRLDELGDGPVAGVGNP